MVLMGENVIKGIKKKKLDIKSKSEKNNVMLNEDSEAEEK